MISRVETEQIVAPTAGPHDEVHAVVLGTADRVVYDTLILEHNTIYRGADLFVQNPFSGSGVGFCVTKVVVNDYAINDQISSSAFQVDLSNFELGDSIHLKLFHSNGCQPKILPTDLRRGLESRADIIEISASQDSLFFTTENELWPFYFAIEQYRWQAWRKVGEVAGVGVPTTKSYSFALDSCLISGENRFRIRQRSMHKPKISKSTSVEIETKPIEFKVIREKNTINFTQATHFMMIDGFTNVVKKGYDSSIDISNLKKGEYRLNYDSIQEEVISIPR